MMKLSHESAKCELTFNLVQCFEPLFSMSTEARLVIAFRQHHDVCPISRQQVHACLYHLKAKPSDKR